MNLLNYIVQIFAVPVLYTLKPEEVFIALIVAQYLSGVITLDF
jgi:hypothetical protein